MIGKELNDYIENKIKEVLDSNKFPEYDNIHSDTFSELIDKLCITHIRLWYLEDAMNIEKDAENLKLLKRKADITFKEKRPMLVKSIDKIISNMCNNKFKHNVENPKLYKGYENEDNEK